MDLKGVKMKQFNALFYRPDFDGKWLDNSILACTLPYNPAMWNKKRMWTSHAEIWTPDEKGRFDVIANEVRSTCVSTDEYTAFNVKVNPTDYYGDCFTSTMGQSGGKNRPKEDGVVWRPASQVIKYNHRWYYYPIKCSDLGYRVMRKCQEHWLGSNEGYNKGDIADFFNPLKREQDLKKWICSGITWASICVSQDPYTNIKDKEFLGHKITELPSPLRLSHWLLKAPKDIVGNPIDLETGKELYQKAV
jgi:hypothetical protein